jgi:hypothetical protein
MKILFIHFWALHVNRYSDALRELGHDVAACSYVTVHEARTPGLRYRGYDLVIFQDTHLELRHAITIKHNNQAKIAQFTHSESLHSHKDISYIRAVRPDHIFTDQPIGVERFKLLDIPVTWMGHGADGNCRSSSEKDIDVLWVGNRYPEREKVVRQQVLPFLDTQYNVLVHGDGYPHGIVKPSEMFELMSRSKVVIHVGHPVTRVGGYAGTRISDALASGAYVVSTKYPRAEERFPIGVTFVDDEAIMDTTLEILHNYKGYFDALAQEGYGYVLKFRMAKHDMEMVLREMGYGDT